MYTLLLRLAAPLQSWGVQSRFGIRDTGYEPSKSGVIGLVCAALGKHRDENHPSNAGQPPLTQLSMLKMGVRVLREGTPQVDYHTKMTDGKTDVLSHRHYLADADFLVGLQGADDELLRRINEAVLNPYWQLSLGRKSFVPMLPVGEGVHIGELAEVLKNHVPKWPSRQTKDKRPQRLVLETLYTEMNGTEVRRDVPICFMQRRFMVRRVKTTFLTPPETLAEVTV